MKLENIKVGTVVEVRLNDFSEKVCGLVSSIDLWSQQLFTEGKEDSYTLNGLFFIKEKNDYLLLPFSSKDVLFCVERKFSLDWQRAILEGKENYRDEHTGETLREMFNRIRHEFSSYADDIGSGAGGTGGMDFNGWLDWLVASNKLEASIAEANKEWED